MALSPAVGSVYQAAWTTDAPFETAAAIPGQSRHPRVEMKGGAQAFAARDKPVL